MTTFILHKLAKNAFLQHNLMMRPCENLLEKDLQ